MKRNQFCRNRPQLKRALRVESLESRSLMAILADYVLPPQNDHARDDHFVLKADSSQNSLSVLNNDQWGWTYPRSYLFDSATSLLAPSSVVTNIISDIGDYRPNYVPVPLVQISSVSIPKNGTVTISEDKRSLVYTPEKGFEGIDQFEYTIDGFAADKAKAVVNVNVVQPVLAVDDWFHVKTYDTTHRLDVVVNDRSNAATQSWIYDTSSYVYDQIGNLVPGRSDTFKVVEIGSASHGGKLTISSNGKSIDYQPRDGFEGLETFTYTAEDGDGYRDVGQVSIRVGSSDANNALALQESIRQKWLELVLEKQQWHFGATNEIGIIPNPIIWRSLSASSSSITVNDSNVPSNRYESGNNQFLGIGEGDIVETDGSYIYLLSRRTVKQELLVIDVRNAAKPTIASRFSIEGQAAALHLLKDRLVVVASNDGALSQSIAKVIILDVADRTAPKLLRSSEIDGSYRESRLIGDKLYVISNSLLTLPSVQKVSGQPAGASFNETGRQYLARLGEQLFAPPKVKLSNFDAEGKSISDSSASIDLGTAIDIFTYGWGSILNVTTFDVDANENGPIDFDLIGKSTFGNLVVTPEAIYVFSENWNRVSFEREIDISSFSISTTDGLVAPQATGKLAGFLLNRFSVGTFQGDLQVAHSEGALGSGNTLSILRRTGTSWNTIGKIEKIAPGEQIQSARFMGDRAYVVTFRQVDPLFVFDLSDATAPKMLGELKVPGYSQYLHPISSTHLMGIGRNADEATGLFTNLQVSLFDITDQFQPKLQSRFEYAGGRQTFSPLVEWALGISNSQALGYFSEAGILALPLKHHPDWVNVPFGTSSPIVNPNLPEVEVLKIDPVTGIEKLGEIQSPTPIDRTMRFANYLYALASDRIVVAELAKPNSVVAELLLTTPISSGNGGGTGETKTVDEKLIIEARQRFHNLAEPCDVNGDGVVAPVDALNIINFLKANGHSKVAEVVTASPLSAAAVDGEMSNDNLHWDVNSDGDINPLDVLVVINQLRRQDSAGEGEASAVAQEGNQDLSQAVDTNDLEKLRSRSLR